eukprot:CAMPEP_0170356710 /NCGR_PEP_ID=MMETSP0117_2-20130122/1318_1 /TAXON_ID=400756 /ORGANISM="Durinskia baltica, Strain CSIRO CS-38" /LENGTH=966 /DNA_ID=CAMNT_0010610827 /DNA_START=189 /DNA_END=3089 /DNA_ORIENTATION=-
MQAWWHENQIYEKLIKNNVGETYTLHDGPPYANGDLHIGHALNKILKDFINKYQILQGRKVRYVPGWDCHGLPIELKVLQGIKNKERESLTPIQLRKKAMQFAEEAVESQKTAFKRYGVWGDWGNPYLTAKPAYEAAQIRVFGKMVERGHIYRGKKPVHWSPSSRTALAEAELEYPENHISRSIYVGFKAAQLSEKLKSLVPDSADVRIAIWTTTPWTIPSNLAVAVHGALEYCVATHPNVFNGAYFIVGRPLVSSLSAKLGLNTTEGEELSVTAVLTGEELIGTTYQHPLCDRVSQVVLGGDYINMESGTGLVHTAPGHGQEDYLTGLKYNLPLLSPVNDLGQFTAEAGERFCGKSVLKEGNEEVILALQEVGCLIKEEAYNHKYPYDWRTKKPTIFRATEQWFASVNTFREEAIKAIDGVQWIPSIGRNRITAMTQSRGDWCISRQRAWGVPIPVFYNIRDNMPLMTPETLAHIESVFAKHGSDAWWEFSVADLLPAGPLRDSADEYTKGMDTMDVWFDSGTSWAGVLQESHSNKVQSEGASESPSPLDMPADMYLEGSDQHRGWFQSSLLTSVAAQGVAPYKTVLTHGFVLDEKGYKMSKSLGNVIDPARIIEGGSNQKLEPAYGADTLRLWVSGVDYSGDVCVGSNIMKQVSESSRKLRNTMRYLLGSVSDFNPAVHAVPYEQLASLDKYTLGRLTETVKEIDAAYKEYQFSRVNQALLHFATSDLSVFYLETAKDRLYISSQDEFRRRSCQTVIAAVLVQLSVAMAPIVPHMAEEVWRSIPFQKPTLSVFERGWVRPDEMYPAFDVTKWDKLKSLRNDVNRCIEIARKNKLVGASMESKVYLYVQDKEEGVLLKSMLCGDAFGRQALSRDTSTVSVDDLRFVLMVSQVEICSSLEALQTACPDYQLLGKEGESGVAVGVTRADGKKCERCWYYSANVGEDHVHSELCLRCADVVTKDKYEI